MLYRSSVVHELKGRASTRSCLRANCILSGTLCSELPLFSNPKFPCQIGREQAFVVQYHSEWLQLDNTQAVGQFLLHEKAQKENVLRNVTRNRHCNVEAWLLYMLSRSEMMARFARQLRASKHHRHAPCGSAALRPIHSRVHSACHRALTSHSAY